ncbi:hypothetical protein AMECASPLE_012265 [Ameca splendens]|uniref:Uncharacterized protein n=1 Tax=Ameca splendens TaxID=208324 RepID=A0ABV1A8E6_9TELE
MHAWGEHANSMQKDPRPGIEPRTFLLHGNSATNCVIMQPVTAMYFIKMFSFVIMLSTLNCLVAEMCYTNKPILPFNSEHVMTYTIMGKTADLILVQKSLIPLTRRVSFKRSLLQKIGCFRVLYQA